MIHTRSIAATLAALSLAAIASAHVFWVQPAKFTIAPGDILKIQLHVGDTFPGEITPRNDEKIEKFVVVGPGGEKPAVGRDADPIAAVYRPTEPGTYLIAYRSKPTPVTLEAEKFETYLREKGLEKIIEQRTALKQNAAPAKEIFSRSSKAIFSVGDKKTDEAATKAMGFRVEILARANPASLKSGDTLPVTVKSDGKPLANALVQARNTQHPESTLVARTDVQGRLSLKLSQPGIWVIDTVDMFPAPKESGSDWESVWASLTFELPPAAQSPGAKQ